MGTDDTTAIISNDYRDGVQLIQDVVFNERVLTENEKKDDGRKTRPYATYYTHT